jgi:hypothetical protein
VFPHHQQSVRGQRRNLLRAVVVIGATSTTRRSDLCERREIPIAPVDPAPDPS